MRGAAWIAVVLAASACGRSDSKPAATQQPPPTGVRPDQPRPVARPTRVPTFVTLDEVTPKHPALADARIVAALALDESGKQATATGCVVSVDATAAMTSIAARYEASGWTEVRRDPAADRARGAFGADYPVVDGVLHVQAQLRTTPACAAGELTVALAYMKMVPVARAAPPAVGGTDRAAPPR